MRCYMFEIFLLVIRKHQKHSNFTYGNTICYQYFGLLILIKVCLLKSRYLFFPAYHKSYHLEAAIESPKIKVYYSIQTLTKYLTKSLFIVKLQAISLEFTKR